MLQVILFYCIELLLVHSTTQSTEVIEAQCNEDVELKCPCEDITHFDSVSWYKHQQQKFFPIVVKRLPDGNVRRYSPNLKGTFADNFNLLLSHVTVNDTSTYRCAQNAKVGFVNKELKFRLNVQECVTTVTTPVLTAVPTPSYREIPLMWSLGSYVALGVLKITVSITCVLLAHHHFSRKQKYSV